MSGAAVSCGSRRGARLGTRLSIRLGARLGARLGLVAACLLGVGLAPAQALAPTQAVEQPPNAAWLDRIWPIDAPITDPFRPPDGPYGKGNRGLEFATQPGSTFVATADGTVHFAGQVGGRLFVTTRHADGLRISYSWIATYLVRKGERVTQGQPLGTTGDVLHVGVREPDDTYLDPAIVFGPRQASSTAPPLGPARLTKALINVGRLRLLLA